MGIHAELLEKSVSVENNRNYAELLRKNASVENNGNSC